MKVQRYHLLAWRADHPELVPHKDGIVVLYKDAQAAIAERDRIIAADDARLREAGERVGLYNGCDTADAMADRIEHLRSTITERDAEIERLRKTMTIVIDLDLARQAVADLLAELERRGK